MKEAKSGNQLNLQNETTVDLQLFDELYRRYHQAVYANICKMVQQPQAAEDILQEVFLALWENRSKLDAAQVAGWLFVVSYNKAASFLKKKLKEPVLQQNEELPESPMTVEATDEVLYELKLSIVEEAVNHLPARKKEVFRLCRYEGKSHDEVAAILGISVVSVKDYLKQSTQFIKKYVSVNYPQLETTALALLVSYFSTR